jgi:muramoyltetrapeptide carboxypeptidase
VNDNRERFGKERAVTLKKGDTIGIVAPSSPVSAQCPRRTERGLETLRQLGYRLRVGKTVCRQTHHTAGTIQERVDDLHLMFLDDEVKVIIATIGGFNANDLLDRLDYDLIWSHNKPFVGFSDITILLSVLHERCDVKSIMGPMLLPQFGEFPEMFSFTRESFLYVMENLGTGTVYQLPCAAKFTEELLWWDKEDDCPKKMQPNGGWTVIAPGQAEGRLMAANLSSIMRLPGTSYFPSFKDAVWFIEIDDLESAATFQRMLQQLKHTGALQQIKALLWGRFQHKSGVTLERLREILANIMGEIRIPMIANLDFGHTQPILSLPYGKQVMVSTDPEYVRIVL